MNASPHDIAARFGWTRMPAGALALLPPQFRNRAAPSPRLASTAPAKPKYVPCDHERMRTCVHEASHAVCIAALFGRTATVESVVAYREIDGDEAGHCIWLRPTGSISPAMLATVAMAGPAGSALLMQGNRHAYGTDQHTGWQGDVAGGSTLLDRPMSEQEQGDGFYRAWSIIRSHRACVTAMAQRLFDDEELGTEDVEQLLLAHGVMRPR